MKTIHRREACKAARRRASVETVEALDEIERELWRWEWRGMGELSARDAYVALIKAAREHGEAVPAGVRVSISVRTLALAAAVSKRTAENARKKLKATGLIRSDNAEKRSGTQAGAFVLLACAKVEHSTTVRALDASVLSLRAPSLRWSAPAFERIGTEVYCTTIRRLVLCDE